MKQKILIAFVSILVTASICAFNLTAGTIKATGINQGDLYKFLSATVTLCNSLKTNLNYNTASTTTNVANYNSVYANYSASLVTLNTNITRSQTAYARFSTLYTTLRTVPGTGYNNFSSKMAALSTLDGTPRATSVTSTIGGSKRQSVGSQATVSATSLSLTQ
jgi:hypothetical protein